MTFLYIDPGTGSMLFSLAIGVVTTLIFALRALAVKVRFVLSGGKAKKIYAGKIPFVIYSDHKRYWNVFEPICDEFERRKIPLMYYTQSADDPVLSKKYDFVKAEFIGEGNKGFVRMNMLNAGTVISTTPGLDVLQWKRSKNVDRYVHVPHAVDDRTGCRMFGLDYYDAVLLTGEYQKEDILEIERLRNLVPKKLVVVGSTYMDANFEHLKNLPSHETNVNYPTVLLAPSWGGVAILSRFGEILLDALVKTKFKIIVRPHPQSKTSEKDLLARLESRYKDAENLSWNYDNDNLAVMNESDILITDFSGIIFDYAFLLNRPLIYADTKFDNSVYDAAWIDRPQWRFRILPTIGIPLRKEDFPNMKEVIEKALLDKNLENGRKMAKLEAWQNQGKSAESTVDFLLTFSKGGNL
ncbi:MAG: CDP-glycerol--glycerophosphate glycerophosphotransferase [Treponema sp.]|nr:CDP-glycerol--glycerophosphate glycerophosphotransferase [Treponema sp.]